MVLNGVYLSAKVRISTAAAILFYLFAWAPVPSGFAQTDYVAQELDCLNNADPAIRDNAAQSLGKFKDPRGFEPLVHALKDEAAGVRASAAIALGQIGDLRAIEPLVPLLKDSDAVAQA